MFPSQDNSITYEQLHSLRFEHIQAELANWERIVFQGDMDGSRKQGEASSNSGDHTSSKPVNQSTENTGVFYKTYLPGHHFHGSTPPHVPPEAYNYLIHALISMQGAIPPPVAHNQSSPYHQGQFPAGSSSSVFPNVPQTMHSNAPLAMSSTAPLSHVSPAMMTGFPNSRSTVNEPPAFAPSNTAISDPGDMTDEAAAIAEDKRRRNTTASARFRTKKKQKTLNLERSVADLTGRTEELEREASELRRENSWLKEIVLLKSRRRGAFGGSQASSSQQASTSSAQKDGRDDDPSSDEDEGHGTREAK
ncbi:hypothetical protein DEU56DRAFT_750982 [Suillus clintonianus]|uniref:uncharacterized protein n=1 Tax=Suillus clintonianus TaxID=1904413 RepID=UPI001B86D11F|nr:uncharacterized protein DEU56DRAFT_750982 [Suillus clintonianus]KAG2155427.1 hypothetical protein DEU56DRAFT_750982 [Suillus clintonianus]